MTSEDCDKWFDQKVLNEFLILDEKMEGLLRITEMMEQVSAKNGKLNTFTLL